MIAYIQGRKPINYLLSRIRKHSENLHQLRILLIFNLCVNLDNAILLLIAQGQRAARHYIKYLERNRQGIMVLIYKKPTRTLRRKIPSRGIKYDFTWRYIER